MEDQNPAPDAENIELQQNPSSTRSGRWRHWHRLKSWYGSHKKWSIPLTIAILLAILAGVPWTRYNTAGLILKKDFAVQITDATAHIPVSGATVQTGTTESETNAEGWAVLHLKVGPHSFVVSKKYYMQRYVSLTVSIFKAHNPPVQLVATGRQAKIHVYNFITQKALPNVNISVAGASAKTDSSGNALVVVPANGGSQKASLSLDGYNDASLNVQVSDSTVKENDFSLTPSGEVYFLNNQSGKIDVLKTNLDGSGVQTAVAGTGNEDQNATQLLESADGKFVALVAKRATTDPTPQLYVLSTADDKLLEADTGNATFQLYDWAGDNLVYTVQRQDLPVWQQGASKIKAYDAETGGITLLDQSLGADPSVAGNENYTNVIVTADMVIYAKTWSGTGSFTGKQDSLQTIGIDGKNHQTLATYDASTNYLNFNQHGPDTLYIWQQNTQNNGDTYSEYQEGSTVKPLSITNSQFYEGVGTYYFSASRQQSFWSESSNGKNSLLVGDQDGNNPLTIASDSDYQSYGWYGDQYLLVSKDSNTLYIMGVKGGTPVKISDYLSTGNYGY